MASLNSFSSALYCSAGVAGLSLGLSSSASAGQASSRTTRLTTMRNMQCPPFEKTAGWIGNRVGAMIRQGRRAVIAKMRTPLAEDRRFLHGGVGETGVVSRSAVAYSSGVLRLRNV